MFIDSDQPHDNPATFIRVVPAHKTQHAVEPLQCRGRISKPRPKPSHQERDCQSVGRVVSCILQPDHCQLDGVATSVKLAKPIYRDLVRVTINRSEEHTSE